MFSFKQYINGEMVEGAGRRTAVLCPGTGEEIGEIMVASEEQAQNAHKAAKAEFPSWSKLTVEERGEWMIRLRDIIHQERDTITDIMAHETGKLVKHAILEVDNLEKSLSFFLPQAKSNYHETIRDLKDQALYLSVREPLGVVVGYLAWNFPISNLATKLA